MREGKGRRKDVLTHGQRFRWQRKASKDLVSLF